MKHLEAWHDRHERTAATNDPDSQETVEDLLSAMEKSDNENRYQRTSGKPSGLGIDMNCTVPDEAVPEWLRLNILSKEKRASKSRQTRASNRTARERARRNTEAALASASAATVQARESLMDEWELPTQRARTGKQPALRRGKRAGSSRNRIIFSVEEDL